MFGDTIEELEANELRERVKNVEARKSYLMAIENNFMHGEGGVANARDEAVIAASVHSYACKELANEMHEHQLMLRT